MNKLQMTLSKKEDFVLFTLLKRIEDFEKSSRAMQKATYAISLKNKEMLLDLERKVWCGAISPAYIGSFFNRLNLINTHSQEKGCSTSNHSRPPRQTPVYSS